MTRYPLVLLILLSCSPAAEETLITISGSSVGKEGEILVRQSERFERANPGVRIRVQQTPDDATQRHQLYVQWLNARVGRPDVLQLDVIWTAEFAAAGWILPLDRFAPAQADFFPATIEANRWQGALFALPWFVDVGMLYRRTDLTQAAPQTIDELNEAARNALRAGQVRHGIVWQGARYEGLITVFVEFLGAFGGTILSPDGRILVNSDAGVRALTAMREQVRNGIAPREVLTWHEEECRFAFQNGTALFMRNWPYAVSAMSDTTSRVAGRFVIDPMPAASGGRPAAALGGAQLAINTWSEHPDLAYRLIAFLTAPEQMLERAAIVGQYPARSALYDGEELRPLLGADPRAIRKIIAAAVPRPVTPVYAELSDELQVALHRALTGEADVRSALDAAAARMQAVIDDSGLRGAAR
jgi:multiple sugar transport system substrate-binding protein